MRINKNNTDRRYFLLSAGQLMAKTTAIATGVWTAFVATCTVTDRVKQMNSDGLSRRS